MNRERERERESVKEAEKEWEDEEAEQFNQLVGIFFLFTKKAALERLIN